MSPRYKKVINEIKNRIVTNFQPEKILLFGSTTEGKLKEGSDIDLLVIINDHHPLASLRRIERAREIIRFCRPHLISMDNFVYTSGEIKQLQETNEGEWDLILEVLARGKVVYEKQITS